MLWNVRQDFFFYLNEICMCRFVRAWIRKSQHYTRKSHKTQLNRSNTVKLHFMRHWWNENENERKKKPFSWKTFCSLEVRHHKTFSFILSRSHGISTHIFCFAQFMSYEWYAFTYYFCIKIFENHINSC